MGFVDEFKAFIMRGNVVDLAVGVVIGGAFGKIVTSMVNDILMPIVGFVAGGVNFSHLGFTLREAAGETPAVVLKYGSFIQTTVDFLIVGFTIFVAIKAMNSVSKNKKEEESSASPASTLDQMLLTEIRDILKK